VAACAACGTDNSAVAKFCMGCGVPLARTCPGCGATPPGEARFCPECGTALDASGAGAQGAAGAGGRPSTNGPPAPRGTGPSAAERRLVSVLFVDLVGFTAYSQSRDPEEVRELLSRYFEVCSSLVERYGGTVEKFIGDAVMAVWGAPVAQEDDAERAVRTALDVVDAVAALGEEIGATGLAARAGVLTGEAAVTIGAKGQGMVAGDLVNTASRIQSVADPGTVLVGDATRRATEAAIAYEPAGTHVLKGKTEPVALFRALRVVAGVGGLMKSEGLEPPFVGRDRELKLVKDLFHASTEASRAQLVQVTGIAGIGKSRLVWEFFKYMDGLRSTYLWHRGRCLAYGEGVTYWALAEMVRGRAGILEGEERGSALGKLRTALDEYVPDAEDRRFVEPRLAQLIGLEERAPSDRQELFSAWRLFIERLSDQTPVVMVFEDMQWADPSLLEFLGHLLEGSRSHPIFVMALARPETAAAALGATHRNAAFLHLEALSTDEMRELLSGFAPGLPADLTERILERAEGVPLYAVETVRMLLDRGLLVQEGAVYRPTGPIGSLEVPESLHALIAARLDGLSADERRLVQTASVLGKSFTRQSLAALAGPSGDDGLLDDALASLVAKEVLTIHADPRSSERGQYGFVQDLMRTVAYETLSRHDRRRLHLEAAAYLESAWGADEEEIVEVVASHLLEAWKLDGAAPDSGEIKVRATSMLVRAGERAASLGAPLEALGYFEQASALTDDLHDRAGLTERAGEMANLASRYDDAVAAFERAGAMFAEAGEQRRVALCQARLASAEYSNNRLDDALERMAAAHAAMAGSEPDESVATVTAQLGRFLALAGRNDEASAYVDEALELAQHLGLPELYAEALTSRAVVLINRGRLNEALALLLEAQRAAAAEDLSAALLRAYFNLLVAFECLDRSEEGRAAAEAAAALARRMGAGGLELELRLGVAEYLCRLGRWDESLAVVAEAEDAGDDLSAHARLGLCGALPALLGRGELDHARRLAAYAGRVESGQLDIRLAQALTSAQILAAEGSLERALESAEGVLAERRVNLAHSKPKRALVLALEAAVGLGDAEKAESLLRVVGQALPGEVTPWLGAQASRFRARVGALRGDDAGPDEQFRAAEGQFRDLGTPFELGVTLLEHAEWLAAHGRDTDAAPRLAEATAIFEGLGARPWLERANAVRAPAGEGVPA
jgi:class 3 adenylate cyclase/tetratricopeptide (TPR) repeat protein